MKKSLASALFIGLFVAALVGVAHAKWGGGLVQRYEDDSVVVLFDSVGYKTLGLDLVVERELLEREAPGAAAADAAA